MQPYKLQIYQKTTLSQKILQKFIESLKVNYFFISN